ncbi:MAG: HAD-IIA family hydrolase [Acidimicrobiales bacterium]
MTTVASPVSWLCDMDGVLINDNQMVPGADRFVDQLRASEREFLVLTNNALFTPAQLQERLSSLGVHVRENQLWTSALATAQFIHDQQPKGRAFVIGETSLHEAVSNVGYVEDATNPDYVVLGETWNYSFDEITKAIRLIDDGCKFVATNPETNGTTPHGLLPGCGALAALIQSATGVRPYFVGKPNPVMIRDALNILGAHSKSTVMVGDRMDTDVVAGVEAGVETILVLSGFTQPEEIGRYAYQPSRVVNSVADLIDELK